VSGPFHHGLTIVFSVAAGMALVSAVASALRGGHQAEPAPSPRDRPPITDGTPEISQARPNGPS